MHKTSERRVAKDNLRITRNKPHGTGSCSVLGGCHDIRGARKGE